MTQPDFNSVVTRKVMFPWSSSPRLEAVFTDPVLEGYKVIMVCDSVPEGGDIVDSLSPDRMSTLICRFPRVILPEVNTHRVFSRNSASSRARSFKTTIRGIMEEPYIPLWTVNQKGMGGKYASQETSDKATATYLHTRDEAVLSTLRLMLGDLLPVDAVADDWEHWVDYYNEHVYNADEPEQGALSIHKQNANRLLEPWMWHEALISSTYWSNFLHLRIDDAAMPEIHALAVLVKAVLEDSHPSETWLHMPFIDAVPALDTPWGELLPQLMSSASECARISYKDRSTATVRDNTVLGKRLLAQEHLSPFEHIAFSTVGDDLSGRLFGDGSHRDDHEYDSNLSSTWLQLRPVLRKLV